MQVSNPNNRINFTSSPLHSVNLKKVATEGGDEFVQAVFSKLNPRKDTDTVRAICEKWDAHTTLASAFSRSFQFGKIDGVNFNSIELVDAENPIGKIIGLMKSFPKIKINKTSLFLQQLITEPSLSKNNKSRQVKGVGEILLGECFNIAKKMGFSSVDIPSSNNPFYFHTFKEAQIDILEGFSFDKKTNEFSIPQKDFDKYINYCRDKYKINF